MAVETMKLLNLVIERRNAHEILKDIAMIEKIHLENSVYEINESNFKLKVDEEHIEEVAGLCLIDTFAEKKDYKTIRDRLYELMDYMSIEKSLNKEFLKAPFIFEDLESDVNEVYGELLEIRNRIIELDKERELLNSFDLIDGIYEANIDFKKLSHLEFFNVKFGTITNENIERLEKNYENIYAAILHIGRKGHNEIYVVISLKELTLETDRILRSVYFEEIKLLDQYLDLPSEMQKKIKNRLAIVNQELEGLHIRAEAYDQKYGEKLEICYSQLMLELKIEDMKKQLAVTSNYVYITGWIAESDISTLEELFKTYGDQIVFAVVDITEDSHINPPTKLANNWMFKPFESLVSMYGTPAYTELDPTTFVGLAYMFLFGAMFGDLGQGLLLILAGYFIRKGLHEDYGGILVRIGISSMAFGVIYDSFFGYEYMVSGFLSTLLKLDLTDRFFIRPIENINQMLTMAVIAGIALIYISYGYSIVNKLRNKNIKEGYFGRNGVNGVILFSSILAFALGSVLNLPWIPLGLCKTLIFIAIIFMVIREPLANRLNKKKNLYEESASAYYIESGFELLETFLGMLSNTISFIRVGAFALNHVGLFMAFHTIAKLLDSAMGDVTMFILGNLIVIALEGLIVLIQGLRLIYFEMFSKYYTGDGLAFVPVSVENIGGNK